LKQGSLMKFEHETAITVLHNWIWVGERFLGTSKFKKNDNFLNNHLQDLAKLGGRREVPAPWTFAKSPPSMPIHHFAEVLQKEEGHQPVTAESPSLKNSGHQSTSNRFEGWKISKCFGLYSPHIGWSSESQSAFWLRLMMDNALSAACRKSVRSRTSRFWDLSSPSKPLNAIELFYTMICHCLKVIAWQIRVNQIATRV